MRPTAPILLLATVIVAAPVAAQDADERECDECEALFPKSETVWWGGKKTFCSEGCRGDWYERYEEEQANKPPRKIPRAPAAACSECDEELGDVYWQNQLGVIFCSEECGEGFDPRATAAAAADDEDDSAAEPTPAATTPATPESGDSTTQLLLLGAGFVVAVILGMVLVMRQAKAED